MLKIATWNVNSIKARGDRLIAWLGRHAPDVLCLQELKVDDAGFPHAAVREAGYNTVLHGQKTYNGVAILARAPLEDVRVGFSDDPEDTQARHIEATVHGMRVMSVYVPNGGDGAGEKWRFKLLWLERLLAYLKRTHDPSQPLLLCGDLNIAPDDTDVARPGEWTSTVLCRPEVRAEFEKLISWGFVDVMRKHHPEGGPFTWWDYRMLGFQKGNGLRIDHILATPAVAAVCGSALVDREERKGKLPSDHAPVYALFDWDSAK
ncbi:MAG TPA: exodeoxyribonuclease III [Polyangiales bacterium]|nr:exodeoxyribonuclease III [Polyangiales bacterium]